MNKVVTKKNIKEEISESEISISLNGHDATDQNVTIYCEI